MRPMKVFNNCVVVAQARVIGGKRTPPHICTLAFDLEENTLIRICMLFEQFGINVARRWQRLKFEGDKDHLLHSDNRIESWGIRPGTLCVRDEKISDDEKVLVHEQLLEHWCSEEYLNEKKLSIGILIPQIGTLNVKKVELSEDKKNRAKEQSQILKKERYWLPSEWQLRIQGLRLNIDGSKTEFDKGCVAWDLYEAMRKRGEIELSHKYPYLITGNVNSHRRSFVVIGILSAPKALYEKVIAKTAIHGKLIMGKCI